MYHSARDITGGVHGRLTTNRGVAKLASYIVVKVALYLDEAANAVTYTSLSPESGPI